MYVHNFFIVGSSIEFEVLVPVPHRSEIPALHGACILVCAIQICICHHACTCLTVAEHFICTHNLVITTHMSILELQPLVGRFTAIAIWAF